jgi:hypothetical protein
VEVIKRPTNSRMLRVDDQEFERLRKLKYLGSTLTEDNNIMTEIKKRTIMAHFGRRDSAVGITSYRVDDRRVRVRVSVWLRIFSSSRRPDRLWGPPSLLSNGHWGLFPQG